MKNGKMPVYLALSCDINRHHKYMPSCRHNVLKTMREMIIDTGRIMEKYFRVARD